MDNVRKFVNLEILNSLIMCDCAEEQQRKRAEAALLRKSPSSTSRHSVAEVGSAAAVTPECGFFTCGFGSLFSWRGAGRGSSAGGGVCPSIGGWLPIAGSILMLAMMLYMLKNMGKHFSMPKFGNMGNLFSVPTFPSLPGFKRSSDSSSSFKCR
ncbi:uncharacterized protein [Battus philenor]|uniref:uncharacterized protein n=1 Tax=Battus philenor TaxID=42288 RepID=UPI0035D031A6